MKEAGLPDGVIQFVPGSPSVVGNKILQSPDLAGILFAFHSFIFLMETKEHEDK